MSPPMYRFDTAEADRAVAFFETVLVHTDGIWAARPFLLTDWQREIVRAVYGSMRWDTQYRLWVRQFSTVWIESFPVRYSCTW